HGLMDRTAQPLTGPALLSPDQRGDDAERHLFPGDVERLVELWRHRRQVVVPAWFRVVAAVEQRAAEREGHQVRRAVLRPWTVLTEGRVPRRDQAREAVLEVGEAAIGEVAERGGVDEDISG